MVWGELGLELTLGRVGVVIRVSESRGFIWGLNWVWEMFGFELDLGLEDLRLWLELEL